MATDQTAVRYPWIAVVLSFMASGVGHVYCGRLAKGFFLYAMRMLLPMLCLTAAFVSPSNGVLLAFVLAPVLATILIFFYSSFDAHAIAKRTELDYRLRNYNRTNLYALLVAAQLAFLVLAAWGGREYAYEPFLMPTRSMSPTFLPGDRILVNKRLMRDGLPKRGDVVVFRSPQSEKGHTWIKRVMGLAGDQIVVKGRDIEVNGKKLERKQVPTETVAGFGKPVEGDVLDEASAKEAVYTVPDQSIFVLGDNRDFSRDSRHIGPIRLDDVIGYVDYIYYPAETWSRFGVCRD